MSFRVTKRNYGHWDILNADMRLFRIRGTPGRFLAMDERAKPYPVTEFRTITACMAFICDELMHEEIVEDAGGNNRPLKP